VGTPPPTPSRRASERLLETVHNWCKRGELDKIKEYQASNEENGIAASRSLSELDHVMQATPLHFASEYGHKDVVEHLLGIGCAIETRDRCGCRPLHYAASNGHTGVVRLLISHGASSQAKDDNGDTPLHWAATKRFRPRTESEREVRAAPSPPAAPPRAARLDPADVPAAPGLGGVPVHRSAWPPPPPDPPAQEDLEAAERGLELPSQADTITMLVKLGQPPDTKNAKGWTPLHCAAYNGNLAAIQALVEAGATVNCVNNDGDTPLHLCASSSQASACDLLIRLGARTTMTNADGKTPAQMAGKTHEGIVELIEGTDEYRQLVKNNPHL